MKLKTLHKIKRPFGSLYKNSIYLILSSLSASGSGIFFWILIARFYKVEELGRGSAIISAMGLIAMLSLLGFDISLARYLGEKKKKKELINTYLTTSLLISIILSSIFLMGIKIWSPSLSFLLKDPFFLAVFIFFTSIFTLVWIQREGIFVGLKKTEYTFILSTITFVRLILAPLLSGYGIIGLYSSYGLSAMLAFFAGIILLIIFLPQYKPLPSIHTDVLIDTLHFSMGNYVARIFEQIPYLLFPLLVINLLGPKSNAYFFIAWQISMLFYRIPRWFSLSMTSEGHTYTTIPKIKKVMAFILSLLLFSIIFVYFSKEAILTIFGENYAQNAANLLVILSLSSFPFAFSAIYVAIQRIKEKVKPVIFIYGIISWGSVLLSLLLIKKLGIMAVGYSWLLSNIVAAAIAIIHFFVSHSQ